MASLISGGLGFGQQNASNPGIDYGGMSNFLQKLDPIGNKITEIGGDPLNIYGHKNNQNALLFPGGQNPNANGVPSILPNLGTQSMIPQSPQGGFMPFGQTNPIGGNGGGIFNQMAANSAGQLFNPSSQFTPQPKGGMQQILGQPMPAGAGNHPLYSMGNFNNSAIGGGSYGRGFQQR